MRAVLNPSRNNFRSLLNQALRKGHAITIFCDCSVEYTGRAVSKLPSGERLVIIKPDRNVIVHKPEGRNPVNWMPEKSSIKLSDNPFGLVCSSVNPREHMRIIFNNVKLFSSGPLVDNCKLRMVGSEADMARLIYENPELISKDFKPVSLEEQTKYGFIDVLGHEKGVLTVVECKRYKAGLNSVQQLRRYVERIRVSKGVISVNGVIAAPSITKNAEGMLKDWGFRFVKVNPPMYLLPEKYSQKGLGEYF